MKLVIAMCLLAFAAVASAEVNGTVETSSQEISSMPASAFVYNPILTNNLDTSAGGESSARMLAQWPTLEGMNIAQTYFVMKGCALRPPHTHQRATGLLYVIQAANMSVGFVTEAGSSVVNYIQSGASAVFPQGLVHYQQNNDCQPAYYTISYSNEDPGTQVIAPAFEALPASVVSSALGIPASTYQNLLSSEPKPAFIPNSDPACVAKCQAAGINVGAPAPSLPTLAEAGR